MTDPETERILELARERQAGFVSGLISGLLIAVAIVISFLYLSGIDP